MTQKISDALADLLKGTSDTPAVGSLSDYYGTKVTTDAAAAAENMDNEEERKTAMKTPIRNHYKEMGLTKDKTNIIKRIAGEIGLKLDTKTKKNITSPKSTKNKSLKLGKKKTQQQNNDVDLT